MAMKSLKNINAKFQLLCRRNEFLNPKLCRFLCYSVVTQNKEFTNVCKCSVDNKLPIHFGEDIKLNAFFSVSEKKLPKHTITIE